MMEQTPTTDFKPTMYERFEDELVERLQMEGVDVRPLPQIAALEMPRPTQTPQVFVLVNGGQFGEREELKVVAQLQTIQCEVFVRAKSRRGANGILDICIRIIRKLLGYRLEGAKSPVYFNSLDYVDGLHNSWQYALTFSFTAYHVEADDNRQDEAPLIRQITHQITTK